MADKPTSKTAGQVFQEMLAEQEADRIAREHVWTLGEVEAWKARKAQLGVVGDNDKVKELNELHPIIEASNARGDFRQPWQMSRDEIREHMAAKGVTGPLWSTAEMKAIVGDPALSKDYLAEVQQAQREGRLIMGPGTNKGEYHHFAGESFVCDPGGRVIARAGQGTEETLLCDLDLSQVSESHAQRLFLRDRRPELYSDWLGSGTGKS